MNQLEEAVNKATDVATPIYEKDGSLVAVRIPMDAWMGVLRLLLPDSVERV